MRASVLLHSCAPDLIPADTAPDVWNVARNVFFRDGETIRVAGDLATLPGVNGPVEVLVYTESGGAGYWVYANAGGIWAHDGTVQHDITPAGWAPAGNAVYTGCVINGLVVINASSSHPVYWSGAPATKCANLPGWITGKTCRAMRAFKNFLFAIGINESGGNECYWSDVAGPGQIPPTWAPAETNLAGSVNLAPLFETCLDALPMKDELIIYKKSSVWGASFVGGNAVFAFRAVFQEVGLAATNAVCRSFDDRHLFVGSVGDVFLFDGMSVQSVLEGRAGRVFGNDFSASLEPRVLAASVQRAHTGVVMYCKQGESDITEGLVYDFLTGDISFRDLPQPLCAAEGSLLSDVGNVNTWDSDEQAWDADATSWDMQVSAKTNSDVLLGTAGGVICISQEADDFAGGPIAASATKMGILLSGAGNRVTVSEIWPRVEGTEGDVLTFKVLAQDTSGGPVTVGAALPYVIGQPAPLFCMAQGRFLGVEVSSLGGSSWRLGAIDFEFRGAGKW